MKPYSKQDAFIKKSLVPSRLCLIGFILTTFFINLCFTSSTVGCNHRQHYRQPRQHHNKHYYHPESIIQNEYNFDTSFIIDQQPQLGSTTNFKSDQPTPPLNTSTSVGKIVKKRHHYDQTKDPILPAQISQRPLYEHESNLNSPIYNFQSFQQTNIQQDSAQANNEQNLLTEGNNLLDPIESGSGSGLDLQPFDETISRIEETMTSEHGSTPNVVIPTPVITPSFDQQMTPMVSDRYDHAPLLSRRLPKLVATAGQIWRFTIPPDTFIDEDGDLRQLKSSLVIKRLAGNISENSLNSEEAKSRGQSSDQYFHWLQYDQSTQTLYGFPTEDDAGRHEYALVVADRWGSTNNETIEISVRQHQSTRAFTHSFRVSGIGWDRQKYQSIVGALADLAKRISIGVFSDSSLKNFIMNSYQIEQIHQKQNSPISDQVSHLGQIQSGDTDSISIVWSNASIPVHPCDINKLENLSKLLVDTSNFNWSLETGQKNDLIPSQSLIRSLEPDFKPFRVSISLHGACEGRDQFLNNIVQTPEIAEQKPRVRIKIGKLNWKLGEPIKYRVPNDVFEADKGSRDSRNLTLTLHTIDGLTLDSDPRYDFLEFDQESRTIFGLPYDLARHTGQRELLLTARHPITNYKVHEVFVINIESQGLTTINNRAFRMSLYFMTRTGILGPQERVYLCQRIVQSLGIRSLNFRHDQENSEFIVIDIQKFTTGSYSDSLITHNDPGDFWKFLDKLSRVEDTGKQTDSPNESDARSSRTVEKNLLFKLIWTNETIGHDGNCPVEVIKENILDALERTMIDFTPPLDDIKLEDSRTKNDSVRFYERLRSFFEPELDLIHLRFEPMNACIDALELHDAGNSDIADQADRVAEGLQESNTEASLTSPPPKVEEPKETFNSDEYWSIVVLIVLVVALIFVVMMFFMGMHTYRINQEKKFELQVKLAQARQNSMFLSSMILADQAGPNDLVGQMMSTGVGKPLYAVQDEDRSSRKPVILDNEKQLWSNGQISSPMFKQTALQLNGQTVQTTPLRPNMTFTLDSIASTMQNSINSTNMTNVMASNFADERKRSMTLNRKLSNSRQSRMVNRQGSMNHINHSQSILTVASLATPLQIVPHQTSIPVVYAPLPVVCESTAEMPRESM